MTFGERSAVLHVSTRITLLSYIEYLCDALAYTPLDASFPVEG